jgi:uncharacterized protein YmfQ (DUF2313 family)
MALDCGSPSTAAVPCPADKDMWARVVCDLLPRGFAWDAADEPGTLMHGRVMVIADMMATFHAQACALVNEFRCDTASVTLDSWFADYGLPDNCGIAELCPKVTTIGDGSCASLQEIAASIGKVRIATTDPVLATLTPGTDAYEAELATHGPNYGIDLCCNWLPPEMQCGECWEMGIDQMAPAIEWEHGGCDLGFMALGHCPLPSGLGSTLGWVPLNSSGQDCNIAGYQNVTTPVVPTLLPCAPVVHCGQWVPPADQEFAVGCAVPWSFDYVGTAYHMQVGIVGTSAILKDPAYSQVGDCMELGISQLCAPPTAQLFCFIEQHAHSHVKMLPIYC